MNFYKATDKQLRHIYKDFDWLSCKLNFSKANLKAKLNRDMKISKIQELAEIMGIDVLDFIELAYACEDTENET